MLYCVYVYVYVCVCVCVYVCVYVYVYVCVYVCMCVCVFNASGVVGFFFYLATAVNVDCSVAVGSASRGIALKPAAQCLVRVHITRLVTRLYYYMH